MSALHTAALAALDSARAEVAAGTAGPWEPDADGFIFANRGGTLVGTAYDDPPGLDDAALIVASVNARAAALDLAGMVFEEHVPWRTLAGDEAICQKHDGRTTWPCALYTAALRVVGVDAEDWL